MLRSELYGSRSEHAVQKRGVQGLLGFEIWVLRLEAWICTVNVHERHESGRKACTAFNNEAKPLNHHNISKSPPSTALWRRQSRRGELC
mmetsp:Transcript_321/g.598  ORF Transcript_321/g.598 Transcript_321/m.598 type:complete len:89 (+) Transcript_321:318-584(+)